MLQLMADEPNILAFAFLWGTGPESATDWFTTCPDLVVWAASNT